MEIDHYKSDGDDEQDDNHFGNDSMMNESSLVQEWGW